MNWKLLNHGLFIWCLIFLTNLACMHASISFQMKSLIKINIFYFFIFFFFNYKHFKAVLVKLSFCCSLFWSSLLVPVKLKRHKNFSRSSVSSVIDQNMQILFRSIRHGSQIRPQLSAASPTNRPQPKVIVAIVIIKLKLWPVAGCEAKVAAELSSLP